MRYCKGNVLLVKYPYVKLETKKDGFSLTKANPNDPGIILKSDCTKRIIVSKALDRSYLIPDAIPVEQIPGGLFYRIDQKIPFPAYDDREIDADPKEFQDLCELTLLSKTKLSLLFLEWQPYTVTFVTGKQIYILIQKKPHGPYLSKMREIYGQDLQMYAKDRITYQIEEPELYIPKFFRMAAGWKPGSTIRVLEKNGEYILTIKKDLCDLDGTVIDGHVDAGKKVLVCEECHTAIQEAKPVFQKIQAIKDLDPVTKQIRDMQKEAERIRKMITL